MWSGERGRAPAANPTFCLALHQAVEEARKKAGTDQDDEKRKGLEQLRAPAYPDVALVGYGADSGSCLGFSRRTACSLRVDAGMGEVACLDAWVAFAG